MIDPTQRQLLEKLVEYHIRRVVACQRVYDRELAVERDDPRASCPDDRDKALISLLEAQCDLEETRLRLAGDE